jgi:hypothetical protein
MKLTAEILKVEIHPVEFGESKVHFSLCDDDETACVSFTDSINLSHASFLVDFHGSNSDCSAYGALIRYVAFTHPDSIEVGKVFQDGEF